uniref:Uncharacterized protein n=1 Tax=Pogona vitticeps TaxID=103695 RepID=A0A6J0SP60_9SAUR
MGSEAAWHPVPTSPTMAGMEKRSKRLWGCCIGGCCAGGWILAVIFLGLYLARELSSPAVHLRECQWELQNQTARARAQSTSAQERLKALEAELKQARGELHELWTQQDATNRSLAETQGRWETCNYQLKTMQENATLQVTEAARHEAEKCAAEKQTLQQEISDQAQELKAAHSQSQEERDRCSAQTQELKSQLEQLSSGSRQVSFEAIATAFILSGAVFLLLL